MEPLSFCWRIWDQAAACERRSHLDVRIGDWLNENGAKADFWFLGDRGVSGNGHMMMIESNSDAVAKLVLSWVEGA